MTTATAPNGSTFLRPLLKHYRRPQESQGEGSCHPGNRRAGEKRAWLHRYTGKPATSNGTKGVGLFGVAGATRLKLPRVEAHRPPRVFVFIL